MSIAPGTASAIASVGALNRPPGFVNLHPDVSINYQLNRWLSAMAPQALTDVAEVAARVGTYDQFTGEFLALAGRLLAQGRRRDAAFCLRAADFFLPAGDERKTPTRTRFLELVREVYGIDPGQYDAVPYAGGALPALRLGRPGRGSVLIIGGYDGYLEDRFAMITAITHAGYQVIAFDGPGQGAALEDGGMILTPDWHRPVGAALDHFGLHQATLIGSSLGGCLAIRAAAAEPRITRVVAYDVCTDLLECNLQTLPPAARALVTTLLRLRADRLLDDIVRRRMRQDLLTEWGVRQGQHVFGVSTPHAYLRSAARFITADVSARVRADTLLLAGAKDHYVPAHQLTDQIATLTNARSVTTRVFTEPEHAQAHCQYGNLALAVQVILDWLDGLDERDHRQGPPS